eukprot:1045673-Amphidinium_carterae.3
MSKARIDHTLVTTVAANPQAHATWVVRRATQSVSQGVDFAQVQGRYILLDTFSGISLPA